MTMPGLPSLAAGALLLALLAAGGGYWHGVSVTKARAGATAARVAAAQQAANAELAAALDAANVAAIKANRERQRQTEEIADAAQKLAEDPAYQSHCLDARGLRLLERAVATANGADQ